jgi:hypothetical protein
LASFCQNPIGVLFGKTALAQNGAALAAPLLGAVRHRPAIPCRQGKRQGIRASEPKIVVKHCHILLPSE